MATYTVCYAETDQTALLDLAAIAALPTTQVSLDDIADACELYRVSATWEVQP